MRLLPPGAPTRFDAVLAVMGLVISLGFGLSVFTSVSTAVAGSVASLVAGVAMADGLVWNPPVEE